MIEKKIWGTTEVLIDQPNMSAHRITVVPGGYCSWHLHRARINSFLVVSGTLHVLWDIGDSEKFGEATLKPGEAVEVPAGVAHMFHSLSGVVAMEWYYPPSLKSDDIVRFGEGGIATSFADLPDEGTVN